MMVPQVPAGGTVPVWPRTAIHDSVAAIVKQPAYRRDITKTLLDRILQWIADVFDRFAQAVQGVPHSRLLATIAFATVIILIAARLVYSARLRSTTDDEPVLGRGRGTSSRDPWREAEQLAASEQFTEAAHALYRAALAMLAVRGLVRLHDSKTSGDYARELRRRADPAYGPFRRFGGRYDRVIYGTGVCDAAEYGALLVDARALALVRDSERAA